MLRVRQVTDPLVPLTNNLLKDGLLPPNIQFLFSCNKTVKYPPFIYRIAKKYRWIFSHYGLFIESLIRLMLDGDWKDKLYDTFIKCGYLFSQNLSADISKDDLYNCMGRFVNLSKYISELKEEYMFDIEYKKDIITGHPDLVSTKHNIFDIKNTTKFDTLSMKNGSILQLTAYLALARENGYNPKVIGVILPAQQCTLKYHLTYTEYNHRPFLKLLLDQAGPRIYKIKDKIQLQDVLVFIGSHTKKISGSVYKSLTKFYSNSIWTRPCQIFMRGNRGAKDVKLSDNDIAQTLDYVITNGIRYFTHASYAINLCHPKGNKTKNGDRWATRILRQDLELTSVTGGRGVVVHTGKAMHLTTEKGYDKMYNSILEVLDAATENCPLMIETPVNKGTELCGTIDSLVYFYLRFNEEQRKRLKVCVDTCHVFAAGYQPYNYILQLVQRLGVDSIGLIHINDAQWCLGSCHDGHRWIGDGCIGVRELLKVVFWAIKNGVALVHE